MDVALYLVAAGILIVLILFALKVRRQTQEVLMICVLFCHDVLVCVPQAKLMLEIAMLVKCILDFRGGTCGGRRAGPAAPFSGDGKNWSQEAEEAEMEEREERKRMQELREQERRQEEERERRLEQKQEEEVRRAKEEQERQEEEEYLRLKASFTVEEQGEEEQLTEDQSRNLLQEFIQYIECSKVVLLEDLASHFGMRTQDAIARLQDLLAEGLLTGVIDDRGKFISITPEELDSVAQFIRQRGRISITELAQASNALINLTPESRSTA
uniref:DDRGK domain-containing protein 1 n=1 Tax=Mastacembelus armatus TaxID=205130 RepID=A0A3Q3L845_9TELE